MTENDGITYMTADEMMSGTAMPPSGVVMFTIREVEAIVARHVAEAERDAAYLQDRWDDENARAIKAEAALAEAEQKGAREALLAAADDWNAEYERVTFTHGSRANKIRAALRMATGLARDRAAQIGPTP